MWYKTLAIGLVVLALGACERSSVDADLATASPGRRAFRPCPWSDPGRAR
jgi:hypothetical protein